MIIILQIIIFQKYRNGNFTSKDNIVINRENTKLTGKFQYRMKRIYLIKKE